MRTILFVIFVASAACDDEEDDCDPTHVYLTFHSQDTSWIEYVDRDTWVVGEHPIAVGGTQRYGVGDETECGDERDPLPLAVTNETPQIVSLAVDGATIDAKGLSAGPGTLKLANADAVRPADIPVAPIDDVAVVGDELGDPGAFYVGAATAKIQLLASDTWVVDRGLTVAGDLPHGNRWNLLDLSRAAPGVHAVTVIAGESSWPVDVMIVDHIDDITPRDAAITQPAWGSAFACFFAHANGAVVAGVPWTFDFDTLGGRIYRPNCVEVWTHDDHEMQTTVVAHALGLTATTTVTFTR
ncbi:MAG: hypothetical protein JO257_30210 [Deltaproteobacteria bacterium]|nr:hypothetical protein [Deltaproteobacteria bacterium]